MRDHKKHKINSQADEKNFVGGRNKKSKVNARKCDLKALSDVAPAGSS